MFTVLSLDTSGAFTELALRLADGTVLTSSTSCVNSHDEELALLIKALLERAKISAKELHGVVVGAGPGSFTGLRIGYSFAKGFASSCGLPLFQVGSLESMAWQEVSRECIVVGIADARRSEWFCTVSVVRNGSARKHSGATIMSAEEIEREVSLLVNNEKLEVVGLLLGSENVDANTFSFPVKRAKELGRGVLAQLDFERTSGALKGATSWIEYGELAPLYVRPVAAKTVAERTFGA